MKWCRRNTVLIFLSISFVDGCQNPNRKYIVNTFPDGCQDSNRKYIVNTFLDVDQNPDQKYIVNSLFDSILPLKNSLEIVQEILVEKKENH